MLIADGGGSAPYRLHPPVPSAVPKPTPTPRPPSLDAGPRPTLKTPQVDPRILRAERISRAQLLQQQAAAHQKEAVAEQQRAQQARQRADESQQQARVAEARSSKSGRKEDKTLADQWRKQARDDELNALRCEADAKLKDKQATLEKSKLLDMQEGHASEPSRETQAAQVEAASAASTVSMLYDTPAGAADPLKAAGKTTHQLAKTDKWEQWHGAAQQEIRIAGVRALAQGMDPQAAMRQQAEAIAQRDVDGLHFPKTGGKGKEAYVTGAQRVQELHDGVRAESPSQAALHAEFHVAQKAWDPLVAAAGKKATQADDQITADKKALADAPGGLKGDDLEGVHTSQQAAREAGEHLQWWESRKAVADHGYQQRQADLDVHQTEVDYQVAVVAGDPGNAKDRTAIADAKDARDRALGDQVLVRDQGKSLAAGVTVRDDKADLKAAQDAYDDESIRQVRPQTVTYKGRGGENTQTVYPEGCDKTFWAVPGSKEGKNHVRLGDDGKYYFVSASRGRQELHPTTAQLWAAHDKLHGRKDHGPVQEGSLARQQQANDDYGATRELLGSGSQAPGKLDPVYWERRAGEIEGDLSQAKTAVALAEGALANAQTYGGANVSEDPLMAALGDKARLRDQAQREADALHAVQRWRASPGDKTLLDAAGRAVAKAGSPQAVPKDTAAELRADRDAALKEKAGQEKTAAQPGDKQQAARDKISQLDLKIEHDNNLIAQAEAGNQRAGAVYLNSRFSFGDKAMAGTDGDLRFSLREDAEGRSIGLDVAPPLNYEDLMARATMDGDDQVLGDSGIRILHDTLGLKDVWEVPMARGMKQYIYQRDGQVFTTRTLADPGVRLSAQTEELWQRLWKSDAQVEKAGQAVAHSATKVENAAAEPAPAQPAAPPGLDGKPVKVPTLWDGDLGERRDELIGRQRALGGSVEGSGLMPEVTGMLQAELDAVTAMKAAQDAHRALQQWKSGQGTGATEDSGKGKELRQAVSDAEDRAIDKKDKWLAQCRSHGVEAAKAQHSAAQARHQQWKDQHPALVGTEAERGTDTWAALKEAEGQASGLRQQHIEAATPAAKAAQKALIAKLPMGQRQDTGKLHDLFMANPEVMAQPLINEHFLAYGSGPLPLAGRTHLNNEVSSALGFTPDSPQDPGMPQSQAQGRSQTDLYSGLSDAQKKSRDAVADEIVGIGGKEAKVTLLPVVYSTPQGGVVKATLFKVENGPGGASYVDERGARYKDLDDYRANNALPSTDCNLVMPASDKVALDSLGNVKLQVRDARTETDWETFKRRSHFDTIVGGASVVLGVVMTVGSGGMLAPVAAGLLVAASAYGATTSVMSLSNRASHGLSINPFTDREARLDWLNLAGSALAVPTLSAATRAGMVAWQATRAAKAAGAIETGMPWLAIRGSRATGKYLAGAARAEGPAGAQAAAMQNKINAWSAPARVMARPTMAVGGLGLEENTRYMADNWASMSSAQRWEQGGMTLLNLVDFASPVLVRGVQAGRQGARGPAGSEPATPVPPREPVPDLGTQTIGRLPDAWSTDAGMARLAALSPAAADRIRQRLLNDIEQVVRRARNHEQGNGLSLHEAICASRTERAFGLQLRPSTTDGIDLHGPTRHAGQRWQNVSLKGPFLTKDGLLPLPPQAQRHAIGRVEGHIRGNTAVDVHVVDLFGLSEQTAHDMQTALTAPALTRELAQRNQRVVFLPRDMPAGYESGVTQLLRTVSGRGANQGTKFAGHAADDTTPSTQLERRDPQRHPLVRYTPLSPRATQPGTPARQALAEGVSVAHGRVHPGARQVNPTRSQDNCVPSAVTYDRMRHDPDSAMSAVPSQPQAIPHVIELYGGLGAMEARGSTGLHGAQATHSYLASLPEGTRGFLALMPQLTGTQETPGHMINFEVRHGGRVEMIDAQAGRHVNSFEAPRVAVLVTHRPGTEPVNPSVVGGARLRRYLAAAERMHEGRQEGGRPELAGEVYGSARSGRPAANAGQTAAGSSTPIDRSGEAFSPKITKRPDYVGGSDGPAATNMRQKHWARRPNAGEKAQLRYLTLAPSPDGSAALVNSLWNRFTAWHNWSGGFLGRRDDVGVIYLSGVGESPRGLGHTESITLADSAQVHGSFAEARARTVELLNAGAKGPRGKQADSSAWVFRVVGHEGVLASGLRDGHLPVDTLDGAVHVSRKDQLHPESWANRHAAYAPKPGDEFYRPPQAPGRLKRAAILAGSFVATGLAAWGVGYLSYRYGHGSSLKPTVEWLGQCALGATAYRATVASGRWIAATRLDQRVDNLQGLLQAAGSGEPERMAALQTLQKQLTGLRGAARGIAHHDRLNYHLAIEGLRRNPTDPQFNAVLLTAKDKVLSPTSVLGRTHLAARIVSFAFSNASAAKFADSPTAGWADYGTGATSTVGNTAWATQNTADILAASRGQVLKEPSPGAKERLYAAHPLPEWMGKDGRLRAIARALTLRHLTAHDGTRPNLEKPSEPNLPMVKPPWSMRLKQYAARIDEVGMMATVGAVDAVHAVAAAASGHPAAAAAEVGKVLFGGVLIRAFQKDRIDEVRTNHKMAPVVYETRNPFNWLNAPSRGAVEYSDSTVATTRIRQAGLSAMVLLGAGAVGRVTLGLLAPWEEDNGKRQPAPPGPGAGPSATPSARPGATPSTSASTPSRSVSQAPSSSAPPLPRRYPPNLLP